MATKLVYYLWLHLSSVKYSSAGPGTKQTQRKEKVAARKTVSCSVVAAGFATQNNKLNMS